MPRRPKGQRLSLFRTLRDFASAVNMIASLVTVPATVATFIPLRSLENFRQNCRRNPKAAAFTAPSQGQRV